MQAHAEGTPQLAMQMGFAARSAVTAVELACRGMPSPRAPITGEFGYLALFEDAADSAPFDELAAAQCTPLIITGPRNPIFLDFFGPLLRDPVPAKP